MLFYRRSWWITAATIIFTFPLSAPPKHSFKDMNNPIIDEIRQARAALAAEHDYNLVRINDWARQQTEAHRQLGFKQGANKTLETTGGAVTSQVVRKRRVRPSGVSA